MDKKRVQPPQSSLILRILGGGYLVYLAYDLAFRSSTKPSGFILIAAIVFALVGGVLTIVTLRQLLTHEYFYQKEAPAEEEDAPEPELPDAPEK